jgi:hypothetical protein
VIVCFGHFFQIDRSSPKFLEYFLRRWNGCNDFDKKWLRLNFGRLFFSKTHLVTLFITRVPNSASISLQVVLFLFLFLLRNYFLTIFFLLPRVLLLSSTKLPTRPLHVSITAAILLLKSVRCIPQRDPILRDGVTGADCQV